MHLTVNTLGLGNFAEILLVLYWHGSVKIIELREVIRIVSFIQRVH